MLKHGILGLLNYSDMTGYEIMEVFRDSLKYFWSAQTSQIYRELQTLKKQGWVTDVLIPQEARPDKKVFSITDSGKQELHRWLSEDDTGFDTKSPLLMKTFFRGELPPDENIEFFRRIHAYSDAFLSQLEKPEIKVSTYAQEIPDAKKALYWRMTIEYGVMYMNMLKDWTGRCIKQLEEIGKEGAGNEYPCD
ncbi:MAG: PadR family transcriptional regulator [Coprococcus sp.]